MKLFKLWVDIIGVILDTILTIIHFAAGNFLLGTLWSFCAILFICATILDIKIIIKKRKENKK